MKKSNEERLLNELSYLDPMSCGRIAAIMLFIVVTIALAPSKVMNIVRDFDGSFVYSFFMLCVVVMIYTLFAYVAGVLFALIYNIVSKRFGGIVFLSNEKK